MVLISAISEDPPDPVPDAVSSYRVEKESEIKQDSDKPSMPKEAHEREPAPVVGQSSADGLPSSSGRTVYSQSALRVAYIMRSYLSPGGRPSPSQVRCRCRAMMEIVRKEHGKWRVSKLVAEHNHELTGSRKPEGVQGTVSAPSIGMEFTSVDAANRYYYEYGQNFGFKARIGSNRRSAGNGALIMQRFLCCRGNYLMYQRNFNSGIRIPKRGPYKEIAPSITGQVAATVMDKKDEDVGITVQVDSSDEMPLVSKEDNEMERVTPLKEAPAPENIVQKPSASDVGSVETKAASLVGAAVVGKGDGNIKAKTSTSQSRLLRELGLRVSRYTDEERREIISKYMVKRTNRQTIQRPTKVSSRQACTERRQRGVAGRFLSRAELQVPLNQQEKPLAEPDAYMEDPNNSGGEPKVGLAFINEDKAYEFYVKFAGAIGFSVRKGSWDKTARNITRSRVYVCSREGFHPNNVTNEERKAQSETRTGCSARMAIQITPDGKYRVNEFVSEHNHQLAAPLDLEMLRSQMLLAKVHPGGSADPVVIPADYKNYLRSKRTKNMRTGDANALLEYLQKMKIENPSFFYAIQVDQDDQLTNIFWADPRSILDYHYFGDAVCFDTSYQINNYGRPLALFLGVNQHRQLTIFGAALLYDESVQSYEWLFETFKSAMNEKQPKTIFTDQQTAILLAVTAAWPGISHRVCVWHVHQNAKKFLNYAFEGSETLAHDFERCLYDCEEEEEFLSAWETMLEKYNLRNNEWLGRLFQEKDKWALVYGRQDFSANMPNSIRDENWHCLLREYLKPEMDLESFYKKYDKLVGELRYAEQLADYHANEGTPRIPNLRFLWQAANSYSPAVFDMFKLEFEFFMNCVVSACGEVGNIAEYEISTKDKIKAHLVTYDSSEGTVVCSCKKFEFAGIPCCHLLKVLDLRNIKDLPPYYILKRWRKDAKTDSVRESCGFAVDDNPRSSLRKRHSSLCGMLYKIAARAAENVEAYSFMESQSDQLLEQVETILRARILEKPTSSTASKGQQQNLVRHGSNSNECQRLNRKKKKKNEDSLQRNQNGLDSHKRQRGRLEGPSGDAGASLRDDEFPVPISVHSVNSSQFYAPNQLVQGSYIASHQFGVGAAQGFHSITQFSQESSATAQHQQQPFHGSSQMSQACPAPDVNLQFVGGNPQLQHQSTDQGNYTIPVWDFL